MENTIEQESTTLIGVRSSKRMAKAETDADDVQDWLERKGRKKYLESKDKDELDKRFVNHCESIIDRVGRELRRRSLRDTDASKLGVLFGIAIDKRAALLNKGTQSITINVRSQALDRIGQLADRLNTAIGNPQPKVIDCMPVDIMPHNTSCVAINANPAAMPTNPQRPGALAVAPSAPQLPAVQRVKRAYHRRKIKIDKSLESKRHGGSDQPVDANAVY